MIKRMLSDSMKLPCFQLFNCGSIMASSNYPETNRIYLIIKQRV